MCLTYRGDHKEPEKRKPIPTKIIAGMLETAGTSQVDPENFEQQRKKMWYGPQSKEMEAKPYFDVRILVIHMKITIL